MDPTAITRFLDSVMLTPSVSGAIIIDTKSGLCLGAVGKARDNDAPQLTVASWQACDNEGIGVVSLRRGMVMLRKGENVLVGVFKNA
ncbi:hypothetical protein BDD12DRAFT_757020 [Trichophaea hybrida]|nr:hypothetical protein BDD12DRAFT_757020 [Trichophaea hybrida]